MNTNFKFKHNNNVDVFGKLEKRFGNISPETLKKIGGDAKTLKKIQSMIVSQHKQYIDVLENNMNNKIPSISPTHTKDYIYIGMLQHSGFPRLSLTGQSTQILNLKTGKEESINLSSERKIDEYICKIPKNTILMDVVDSGGATIVNKKYEDALFFSKANIHKVLQGYTKTLLRSKQNAGETPNQTDKKLLKYLNKNAKYYYPGDYAINYSIHFEKHSEADSKRWLFVKREYNDDQFHIINDNVKGSTKTVTNKLKQFHTQTKERNSAKVTLCHMMKHLSSLFPKKTVVFIPISCRPIPFFDVELLDSKGILNQRFSYIYASYYLSQYTYLLLITYILQHGHNNFLAMKAGMESSSINTPDDYKNVYGQFFQVHNNERQKLYLMNEYATQNITQFLYEYLLTNTNKEDVKKAIDMMNLKDGTTKFVTDKPISALTLQKMYKSFNKTKSVSRLSKRGTRKRIKKANK
jgi:hypothetical protein